MKYKKKVKRLLARQKDFDTIKEAKGFRRPGSFKR